MEETKTTQTEVVETKETPVVNENEVVIEKKVEETSTELFDDYKEDKENKKTTEEKSNEDAEKEKQQSKKDNERFARERREKEAKEREIKEVERKAYEKGLVEAVNGVNPYTNEPITDSHDIQEFLTMREIDRKGLDPIADYHKYLKQQAKEKENKQELNTRKEKDADWFRNDLQDFNTKHPDISLEKLQADTRFVKFSEGKVGNVPLSKMYEDYTSLIAEFNQETDKKIRAAVAKALATPGSADSSVTPDPSIYSLDQIKKMSQKEIDANYDKVQKSLSKIYGSK